MNILTMAISVLWIGGGLLATGFSIAFLRDSRADLRVLVGLADARVQRILVIREIRLASISLSVAICSLLVAGVNLFPRIPPEIRNVTEGLLFIGIELGATLAIVIAVRDKANARAVLEKRIRERDDVEPSERG